MTDRVLITLIIFGALVLLRFGWQSYKIKVAHRIQPVEILTTGRPALLYFSADYCAPCRLQQTPIVDRLSAQWGHLVTITKCDVTKQPELALRYKILTLPTTVVLDEQGQVVHLNYGVTPEARLEMQLKQVMVPRPIVSLPSTNRRSSVGQSEA